MPTNLLVLPLLGGFCLVHIFYYFRFRSQRLEGYRLLLESAVAGTGLMALASAIVYCYDLFPPRLWLWGFWARSIWERVSPFDYSGTAALALVLGVVLPCIGNLFFPKRWATHMAIKLTCSPKTLPAIIEDSPEMR